MQMTIDDTPETLTIEIPPELRHKKTVLSIIAVESNDMEKRQKLQAARELVRKYVPKNCLLSEELIADRRLEAGHE